jgi:hypothetical protein
MMQEHLAFGDQEGPMEPLLVPVDRDWLLGWQVEVLVVDASRDQVSDLVWFARHEKESSLSRVRK